MSNRIPAYYAMSKRMGSLVQRERQCLARSLSEIRLIYCGCAGFGQIFRSFSFNSPHYSPQTIEKSASNQRPLVTSPYLGKAPEPYNGSIKKRGWPNSTGVVLSTKTFTTFPSTSASISFMSFMASTIHNTCPFFTNAPSST